MPSESIIAVPRQDIYDALVTVEEVETRLWTPDTDPVAEFGDDLERLEMVIWPYPNPAGMERPLDGIPNLKWVQAMTAGFDAITPFLPEGVGLTNAGGVHAASTSELTLGLILAKRRKLDVFLGQQQREEWQFVRQTSLADSKALIIGAGAIGSAIAARLAPFEVEVTRVGRTAREDDLGMIHANSELPTLVPEHDIVIVIAPLTPETDGMIDAEFLSLMPDNSLLVNVARGGLVDTDALIAELQTGRIEAALDVTDPEPLPAGHPLWSTPNVIITPHIGGASSCGVPRLHELLRTQARRLAAGETLLNVIEPRSTD